jgi:hypothetical protein
MRASMTRGSSAMLVAPRMPVRTGADQREWRAPASVQPMVVASSFRLGGISESRRQGCAHRRRGVSGVELRSHSHTALPLFLVALPPILGRPLRSLLRHSLLLGHLTQILRWRCTPAGGNGELTADLSPAAKPQALAATGQAARRPRAICHQSGLCRMQCAKRAPQP